MVGTRILRSPRVFKRGGERLKNKSAAASRAGAPPHLLCQEVCQMLLDSSDWGYL
jgi:hypothetical protein